MQRRRFLCGSLTALLVPRGPRAAGWPGSVAGVALPQSARARACVAFARAHCPDYLCNHGLRTFVFGTLLLNGAPGSYRVEDAFIAAVLHDLGLLEPFASAGAPFETDGADAAAAWARSAGLAAQDADLVWHAVQMHDGNRALTQRQGPEALLVALGAATDVDGPQGRALSTAQVAAVVAAFPRLGFKRRFTALLAAHCARKGATQHATWLEGFCRAHMTQPGPEDRVSAEIAAAGFAE